MRFSVLTLNLWNVNEPLAARTSALAARLKVLRPDIVCLQEVARRQSALVAEACELPHSSTMARCRFCPAPHRPIAQRAIARGPARRIAASLAGGNADRRPAIAGGQYPSGLATGNDGGAQGASGTLLAAIKRDTTKTKILCGDFNDDPESPAVRLVLDSGTGFHDAYANCRPDNPGFTWSRKNPYVDPSMPRDQRIDYIFATGDLAPKDCSVVFDGNNGLDVASDHFGVFCNFACR
jgi:endonuclease/exonuclease/phosphatase family metal-dependent hydrolase